MAGRLQFVFGGCFNTDIKFPIFVSHIIRCQSRIFTLSQLVSVIFVAHGRRTSLKLRFFPSLTHLAILDAALIYQCIQCAITNAYSGAMQP